VVQKENHQEKVQDVSEKDKVVLEKVQERKMLL